MPLSRILSRLGAVFVGALLVAGALAGCTPEEPEPTPTVLTFASEEEAYAAAEEVYRAYSAAVDLELNGGEQGSSLKYLTGRAYEVELENSRELDLDGLRFEGGSEVRSFIGVEAELGGTGTRVVAEVCTDLSAFRVLDVDGNDITPEARIDVSVSSVTFVGVEGSLRISNIQFIGAAEC